MRNLAILVLLVIATFAAWILATAVLYSPFIHVGDSFTVYFGLVMLPDLASLLIYAVVAFAGAWLASRLFAGSTARTFRVLAVAALVVLFFWIRGAFIISNYRFSFLVRESAFALIIAAVALVALYLPRRGDRYT
jgi:hypothetical protein